MTKEVLEFDACRENPGIDLSLVDRWSRARIVARLRSLKSGSVTMIDGRERRVLGDPRAALSTTVHVHDARFYRSVALGGMLGGAESYLDGYWDCDDLTTLIRILAREREVANGLNTGAARWRSPALALLQRMRRNTRTGSRRNVAAHYDLGNEFFELFLDPTLTYSSGVFESGDSTMEEASLKKYDRVCEKLHLRSDDHILEIGTGWGGFAIYAAQQYGCRVTTTTISQRQFEIASERVNDAGLGDRVDVRLEDYRDLTGCYDKLVSIEMIEAVGHAQLDTFFRICGERLKPDGVMVLQAITIPDQNLETHRRSVDFIKRYIFPGGELVSIGALNSAASRNSDLRMSHLEDLTPHYAETLRRWRSRMFQNIARIRSLGLDDRFLRMWEYYLCYCEGGFEERAIGLVQTVLDKKSVRRPLVGEIA